MPKNKPERVVFQPVAHNAFQRGINHLANVISPTLGPLPRQVAVEPTTGRGLPEMLDNGGLIARRIIALPDRNEDMGAMFLRHSLWHQYEQSGDGTATAAVIFQSVFNEGVRYITAGGNAMLLRNALEKSLPLVVHELEQQSVPVESQQRITQIAESICFDAEMARVLGEVFDFIGEFGHLEIRTGRTRGVEREYVEGTFYKMELASADMRKDYENFRAFAEDASIFISDLTIENPGELTPLLQMVIEAGIKNLVIIAKELPDNVKNSLLAVSRHPEKFQVFAVKAPMSQDGKAVFLEDIAVMTGGQPYLDILHAKAENVQLEHLGQARRAWADKEFFSFSGGKGSPLDVRSHIEELKRRYEVESNIELRKNIRERIGKLLSGSATLWVGGLSETDIKARKEIAERTGEALRAAILKGVLSGGGAALLACRPAFQRRLKQVSGDEEKFACKILMRALEEPTRKIIHNAGYDERVWIDRINQAGPGWGFDVRSGKVVDMFAAGIVDSAGVVMSAARNAIASAALALTVDTLVHHKKPETVFNT
jgi:chaperonin GroEL